MMTSDLFPEAAIVLKGETPPSSLTLPAALGKNPTTDDQVDLATTVGRCSGLICTDSMPSQRYMSIPLPTSETSDFIV